MDEGVERRGTDAEILGALVRQSFRPAPEVEDEPEATMAPWLVFEVSPAGTRHLCGWVGWEGRVSSALQGWDPARRIATTRSGRRYRLEGQPERDRDADPRAVFTPDRAAPHGLGQEIRPNLWGINLPDQSQWLHLPTASTSLGCLRPQLASSGIS